jgi:hypothetical protein
MASSLAAIRARALASLIPPPRIALSDWIESNIRLPEGVSAGCRCSPDHRVGTRLRAGGDGLSAQWWIDRSKAVPVARAARRFAGANPDLSTATAAVHRSAASLGATLTPGDIAIERAGDAAARLNAYSLLSASARYILKQFTTYW